MPEQPTYEAATITAFDVVCGLEPEHVVHLATGSGYCINITAADLRILMGRWQVMDDLPVSLEREGGIFVVYPYGVMSEESDWLFSFAAEEVKPR